MHAVYAGTFYVDTGDFSANEAKTARIPFSAGTKNPNEKLQSGR